MPKLLRIACAGLLLASLPLTAPIGGASAVEDAARCAAAAGGGNWPSYGRDVRNSRHQTAEKLIGPLEAASLEPTWYVRFEGNVHSTPTIAGGCVYAGSLGGEIKAINADTGAVVWERSVAPAGLYGAVTIHRGRAIVLADIVGNGDDRGPALKAFDAATGRPLWTSEPITVDGGTNASPAVFTVRDPRRGTRDIVLAGHFGKTGTPEGQGGYVIVDAATGRTLASRSVIPRRDQDRYAGAPIWSSAAYDTRSGHAYVGTGNPYTEQEHPRTNAILKIDLRRVGTPTFGDIVDSYKGTPDTYAEELQALNDTEICAMTSARSPLYGRIGLPTGFGRPACGQLDIDFGASPNIFRSADGRTYVGEYQKSGVYHVADAATMEPVWARAVGAPCAVCNGGSTAVTGAGVFGVATPHGTAFHVDRDSGAVRWMSPNGALLHWYSTSVANGVVYTITLEGFLEAYDAQTGIPVLRREMALDVGEPTSTVSSAGVSIARHTVYAGASGGANPLSLGFVIAYKPASPLDISEPAQ